MNRENEEQRPVSLTICGALQKEPNCKCLILSVLIYGCLAAVTWCRCANVTKIVINFSRYPIRSTKHVSPCDDGYIYIPVAFMGMLYLVYLVECYHSPIRIDLLHAESQDSVLSKLSQLRSAQPTIWWKAVCYHYVRRKRQITRYRNGDNYTTTQVYYERINTHAATSFYYYDYCGVKDISKELILDPKIPITKIALTKGFAFSNMRSATEFEEARSRFFAEQELRDDYMEMREGLDLGYNPNPTTLVAVLGNPWFTNRCVYWCLSALLLSWPLRVIIEYKTQYADYQVTKLFGINYDTPTGSEPIHASMSQLSQPGSYMLAPSYSEALLMEPAPSERGPPNAAGTPAPEMVPSYSEALLYERAERAGASNDQVTVHFSDEGARGCSCPCHCAPGFEEADAQDLQDLQDSSNQEEQVVCRSLAETGPDQTRMDLLDLSEGPHAEAARCTSCGRTSEGSRRDESSRMASSSCSMELIQSSRGVSAPIPRDMSEPNLRTNSESIYASTRFLRLNGESLKNILENEQEPQAVDEPDEEGGPQDALSLSSMPPESLEEADCRAADPSRGAIPKRILRSRVISNPMSSEACERLPNSKTYFCLKSILKQNKRRYTLITARELQNISDREEFDLEGQFDSRSSYHEGCAASYLNKISGTSRSRFSLFSRSRESLVDGSLKRKRQVIELAKEKNDGDSESLKRENTRTLIFASPIQEVCPGDPFGGKDVVRTRQEVDLSPSQEVSNHTVLTHLGRSLPYDRRAARRRFQESRKQQPTLPRFSSSLEERHPYAYSMSTSTEAIDVERGDETMRVYRNGVSFPPYEGPSISSFRIERQERTGPRSEQSSGPQGATERPELTRSLTERRTRPTRVDPGLRRSFTGRVEDYRQENGRRTNLNMETSL